MSMPTYTYKLHTPKELPEKEGLYLILCYEWIGHRNQATSPMWRIKLFHKNEFIPNIFDTHVSHEIIAWCELPPKDIQLQMLLKED